MYEPPAGTKRGTSTAVLCIGHACTSEIVHNCIHVCSQLNGTLCPIHWACNQKLYYHWSCCIAYSKISGQLKVIQDDTLLWCAAYSKWTMHSLYLILAVTHTHANLHCTDNEWTDWNCDGLDVGGAYIFIWIDEKLHWIRMEIIDFTWLTACWVTCTYRLSCMSLSNLMLRYWVNCVYFPGNTSTLWARIKLWTSLPGIGIPCYHDGRF